MKSFRRQLRTLSSLGPVAWAKIGLFIVVAIFLLYYVLPKAQFNTDGPIHSDSNSNIDLPF